jgi:hypothetical protein
MPDWTKLPKELPELIFKKLDNSEFYPKLPSQTFAPFEAS